MYAYRTNPGTFPDDEASTCITPFAFAFVPGGFCPILCFEYCDPFQRVILFASDVVCTSFHLWPTICSAGHEITIMGYDH